MFLFLITKITPIIIIIIIIHIITVFFQASHLCFRFGCACSQLLHLALRVALRCLEVVGSRGLCFGTGLRVRKLFGNCGGGHALTFDTLL
jgi:hypothetical protein